MRISSALKFISGLTLAAVLTGDMALAVCASNLSSEGRTTLTSGNSTPGSASSNRTAFDSGSSTTFSFGSDENDAANAAEQADILSISLSDSAENDETEDTEAALGAENEAGPDIFSESEPDDSEVLLSNSSSGGISMNISYGYRNTAKSGHKLPFGVSIVNNSDEDIDGSLVVEARGSVEIGIDVFESALNSYSFDAQVPAHGSTVIEGVISVEDERDTLHLSLYNGSVLMAEEDAEVNIAAGGNELLIGLLSDTPEELEYFNGVSVAQTALRARTIELDPDTLPENAEELEQLDVIVISNFSIGRISTGRLAAIASWVTNGGVLLTGSGQNPQAARAFGEGLDGFELTGPRYENVDMGMEYSKNGPDGAVLYLSVCDISMTDGIQIMQASDIAALTMVNDSAGVMGFAAYDLCDINDFCSQELSFTDDLLTALLGHSRIEKLLHSAGSSRELYQRIRSFMGVANPDSIPGTGIYIVFAIVYLAFTGGVLYSYLRNRGLEFYYHAFVVITAFVGAFAVWLMGTASRNEGLSLDYTAVREIHGDSVNETGYIRVFSAAADSYELSIPDNYEIYPIVNGENGPMGFARPEQDREEPEDEELSGVRLSYAYGSEGKLISASGLGPFAGSMLEFAVSDTADNNENEGSSDDITASIRFYDEKLTGTVVNNTDHDIEDAAVLLYGRAAKLGTIRAGESVDVSEADVLCAPTSGSDVIARYITGIDGLDTDSSDYVTALKRAGFLSYYMQESMEAFYNGIRIVGFSSGENIFEDIRADRHADISGTLLKSVAAQSSFHMGRRLWRSALSFDPSIVSGDYDMSSNTSGGSVVLEYSLGSDISIDSLYFTELSEEFVNERAAAFSGRMSIYNYVTGGYDSIDAAARLTGSRLSAYLSPANTITVRYIPDEAFANVRAAFLPVPNVTGDVR